MQYKTTIRRAVSVLLVLLLVFGLTACAEQNAADTAPATDTQQPSAPTEQTDAPQPSTVPDETKIPNDPASAFAAKAALLREAVVTDALDARLGEAPAGELGFVVFFSVSDGTQRAEVRHGSGSTLAAAFDAAAQSTAEMLGENGTFPRWVKVDVVREAVPATLQEIGAELRETRPEFYHKGIAFDPDWNTALLEAELNGAKVLEFEIGTIDLEYLNTYLEKANRPTVDTLPAEYISFVTSGWFCDEDGLVCALIDEGLDYGRRSIAPIDRDYVLSLVETASEYLMRQVQDDGSFLYGYYPRFDKVIPSYNIMRHVSTIWSLICRYRLLPDEELKTLLDKTMTYMLLNIRYNETDEGTAAYLYEEKADEIKLGGNGVAILALSEYMDVFGTDQYVELVRKLANGILTMRGEEPGTYVHVLNGDFTFKEEYRTVYYDGEATFGLCRAYSLTGEQKFLDAACAAMDHFIEADYTQYKDHWIAYSVNELTKHVPKQEYFDFGLRNAFTYLDRIIRQDTTYHTFTEMLLAGFELYDRMVSLGMDTGDYDVQALLDGIAIRVNRQLNGYFFPEVAMYMRSPNSILNAFMVRHDGYRTRIDDVQHNISSLYAFYRNYDRLLYYGYRDLSEIPPELVPPPNKPVLR